MEKQGDTIHVSEEEASGGSKEGVVRWVLIIGLILAIGALSIIWITGAVSSNDPNADNANVSTKIAEQEEAAADAGEPIPPAEVETGERGVQNGDPVVEN